MCPDCATNPDRPTVSSARRTRIIWTCVLNSWSTLLFLMLFAGAFNEIVQSPAGDLVISNLILFPLLIGLGLGLGSMDRRLGNPTWMWIAVGWNVVLLVIFFGLLAIGLASGA